MRPLLLDQHARPDGDFIVLADDEGQQYQISGKLLAALCARGPLAKPSKAEARSAHKRRRRQ
jgi:hypothetical protein